VGETEVRVAIGIVVGAAMATTFDARRRTPAAITRNIPNANPTITGPAGDDGRRDTPGNP